jgi:hypothetical protein
MEKPKADSSGDSSPDKRASRVAYASPLRDLSAKIEKVAQEHETWTQIQDAVRFFTDYLNARARIEELNKDIAEEKDSWTGLDLVS